MTKAFTEKYNAAAFDPNDPSEALAERSRVALLRAAADAIKSGDSATPRALEYQLGGLLVGVVQVMQSSSGGDQDKVDAAIRSSIIQTAAWAVDTARAMSGRDPLSEA